MTRRRAVQIIRPPVTWILVADGKEAHVYTRHAMDRKVPTGGSIEHPNYAQFTEQALVPVPGMALKADSTKAYDIGPDQLGRVQESANSAHHMNAPHMDVHEEVKHRFMQAIALRLNDAKEKKLFDRLVLIAPPKMLGELRAHLDKKALGSVIAELPKDLTQCGSKELADHVNNIA